METKELSMIEQLAQLRITAKSEIAPHEFLFDWNDSPNPNRSTRSISELIPVVMSMPCPANDNV